MNTEYIGKPKPKRRCRSCGGIFDPTPIGYYRCRSCEDHFTSKKITELQLKVIDLEKLIKKELKRPIKTG